MEMCYEMIMLRKELNRLKIEWIDKSDISSQKDIERRLQTLGKRLRNYTDTTIYRTHFEINGSFYSVISGYGTWGGFDPTTGINSGLLELQSTAVNNGEVMGYLTHRQIIKMIEDKKV